MTGGPVDRIEDSTVILSQSQPADINLTVKGLPVEAMAARDSGCSDQFPQTGKLHLIESTLRTVVPCPFTAKQLLPGPLPASFMMETCDSSEFGLKSL